MGNDILKQRKVMKKGKSEREIHVASLEKGGGVKWEKPKKEVKNK